MTERGGITKAQLIADLTRMQQRVSELEKLVDAQKATETKAIEDRLMFEGLFELNPDALILVDSRGSITRVNIEAERMFGYSHEELKGKPHDVLIPEQFREMHKVQMAGYMASPRTRKMGVGLDLFGRKKDGTIFPVDISLGVLGTGKEFVTIIAAVRARSSI
ncbi:MAG: PAS domain S-box protein [Chloroflexi bacterium]|nr:PAS domain S-box protein [Chloroflexota bacterium]